MFGSAIQRRKERATAATPARIEELYVMRRGDGVVLDQVAMGAEAADAQEQRSTASMVICLLGFLRDAECLERYAALGHLRIQQFTFGIHAGKRFALLSVIRGAHVGLPKEQLTQCSEILERLECEPAEPAKGVLSSLITKAGDESPARPARNEAECVATAG